MASFPPEDSCLDPVKTLQVSTSSPDPEYLPDEEPESPSPPLQTSKKQRLPAISAPSDFKRSRRSLVCTSCKRKKIACDLLQPCASCSSRHIRCSYPDVDDEGTETRRLAREAAEQRRASDLASHRQEIEHLLTHIAELKSRSNLSDDDLLSLYERTDPPVQTEPQDTSPRPSKQSPTAHTREPGQKRKRARSKASQAPTSTAEPSFQPHCSARIGARKAAAAAAAATSVSREPLPPIAERGIPPLPPIDMSGTCRCPLTYHFPLSDQAQTKAEAEFAFAYDANADGSFSSEAAPPSPPSFAAPMFSEQEFGQQSEQDASSEGMSSSAA